MRIGGQKEIDEGIDVIIRTTRRGGELARQLLGFAKRQPAKVESVSVDTAISEVLQLARRTIEESITMEVEKQADGLFVYCDAPQLENALVNLIINARDAIVSSRRGNRIMIAVRTVARASSITAELAATGTRFVEISVSDNGPGMSEHVRQRAVDPFFTTKEQASGTGLGLSMVYGFVQQMEGEFRIYSEIGLGTTVRMSLPRGEATGGAEVPKAHDVLFRGQGQTVLVVEDEPDLLRTTTTLLQHLGFRAFGVASGVDALAHLSSGIEVDVLLTDIVMPEGMSGFELAQAVRQQYPHVGIIYMSGYAGLAAEKIGKVDAPFVQKPCGMAELSTALERILGSAAKESVEP